MLWLNATPRLYAPIPAPSFTSTGASSPPAGARRRFRSAPGSRYRAAKVCSPPNASATTTAAREPSGSNERHEKFRAFDFDPSRDIAIDPSGGWRWNTNKPDMHRYVSDYCRTRREDG